VPVADIASFDHLVGEREQLGGNFKAERLSGLDVDHQLEFVRCLHWQISRLLALKNASDVGRSLPVDLIEVEAIGYEPAIRRENPERIDCRQTVPRGEPDDEVTVYDGKTIRNDDQRAVRLFRRSGDSLCVPKI
jgi:hypothetical protein